MLQINNRMNAFSSYGALSRVPSGSRIREAESVKDSKSVKDTKGFDRIAEERKKFASVSKDGDTVWVSEESRAMLEADRFGSVRAKEEQPGGAEEVPDEQGAVSDLRKEVPDEHGAVTDLQKELAGNEKAVSEDEKAVQMLNADKDSAGKVEDEEKKNIDARDREKREARELEQNDATNEKIKEKIKKMIKEERMKEMRKESQTEEEPVREEPETSKTRIPPSTIGRTESELEQMYRNGDISKNDLDKAIESKEARKEEMMEEGKAISRTLSGVEQLSNRGKKDSIEMKNLFGENSSETIDPQLRADLLQQAADIFT